MTANIKELANLPVFLLGVTETNIHLQTENGKGVKTLTAADLAGGSGGGGGGGGTVGGSTSANQVLELAKLDTIIANTSYNPTPATTAPNIEVNDIYYTAIRNFTGATLGDTILVRETINTSIPSTTLSSYRNLETGQTLVTAPVIGTDISFSNKQPISSGTTGTASEYKQDVLISLLSSITTSGTLDSTTKVVVIATGGRPTLRIATYGILNSSSIPVIMVAKATTSGIVWTPYTNFDSSAVMTGAAQLMQIDIGAFDFIRLEAPTDNYTGTLVISLTAMPHPSSAANNQLVHSQSISKVSAKVLDVTATSTASTVVGVATERIVLTATVNAWVELGSAPTATLATGTSFFLPAGVPSYPLKVSRGITKVAVIAESTLGKLSILESS
jgi:uncharacterized RmlC-like cupin family protein